MLKRVRIMILFFAALMAVLSAVFVALFVHVGFFEWALTGIAHWRPGTLAAWSGLAISGGIFLLSLAAICFAAFHSRLTRIRERSTERGSVIIGVDAIEHIALNAAKFAQVGVKNAKASVYASKPRAIRVVMSVVLYSDVEIQTQMAVLQDRVKKDVERYTGIPVASVEVKVNRVELVGAKIEH